MATQAPGLMNQTADPASEGASMTEAAIAFGIILAVLWAMADTQLYPLALGIVGIALLYVLLDQGKEPNAVSTLQGLARWVTSKTT